MRKFAPLVLVAALFGCTGLEIQPAQAASRVWISEYVVLGQVTAGLAQIATLPSLVNQNLDISGGAQSSAAFNASTKYIRVICEVQCAVKGGAGVATTDTLLPSLQPEYFSVNAGATISVIAAP